MNNLLENRKAIVTGGSQGLGYEIAHQFVASGADVIICGRSNSQLKKATNKLRSIANNKQKVFAFRADVSNKDDVKNLVNETIIKLGGCQILVNNAGIYGPKGPIENIDWNEWVKALNININGSVLMCKEIIPYSNRKHPFR